jgi:hypothetical protein
MYFRLQIQYGTVAGLWTFISLILLAKTRLVRERSLMRSVTASLQMQRDFSITCIRQAVCIGIYFSNNLYYFPDLFRCSIKRTRNSSKICIHIRITRRLKVDVETSQIPSSCVSLPKTNLLAAIASTRTEHHGMGRFYGNQYGSMVVVVDVLRFVTASLGCL